MAAERTPEEIQADIERARESLVVAVDQLAERTSPKRLAEQAKQTAIEKAQSPTGRIVLGAAGALVVVWIVRRIRRRH